MALPERITLTSKIRKTVSATSTVKQLIQTASMIVTQRSSSSKIRNTVALTSKIDLEQV